MGNILENLIGLFNFVSVVYDLVKINAQVYAVEHQQILRNLKTVVARYQKMSYYCENYVK